MPLFLAKAIRKLSTLILLLLTLAFQPFLLSDDGAILSMEADPDAGGTTDPVKGDHLVHKNVAIAISATAASGYTFKKWRVSGNGTIADTNKNSTTITLTYDATAIAVFIKNIQTVNLTMAVSPDNEGSTSPATGTHSVEIDTPRTIQATPASGFHFTKWTVSGSATIDDPNSSNTIVTLNSNATVTANFEKTVNKVKMTMQVSPSSLGTVSPEAGEHQVNQGEANSIQATPATGNHFTGWTVTGSAIIGDQKSQSTTATLSGDAVITANFASDSSKVILTIAVDPTNSGTTNPGTGKYEINSGEPYEITAHPEIGYHFTKWTISGNASLSNINLETTWATLGGDATITANFAANTSSATVTMAVAPASSGTTNPGVGDHSIDVGSTIEITATPANGYHFTGWTVSGEISIKDANLADTWAEINGDGTITANFAANTSSATVTMAVSPTGSGTTNPGVGDHAIDAGSTIEITASPEEGYHFTGWTVSGNVTVKNSDLTDTWSEINGDGTITANFEANTISATVTIAIEPASSGTTNPGVGKHSIDLGSTIEINATAASGYHFTKWTLKGNITLKNTSLSDTWAEINGDGTITANFAPNTSTAIVDIDYLPTGAGLIHPGPGVYRYNVGQTISLSASPIRGYRFAMWDVVGAIKVGNNKLLYTWAEIHGDGAITAVFVKTTKSVTVTMAVSPAGSGTTNPGIGDHILDVGSTIEITATPASGYHFTEWAISGKIKIKNSNLADTWAEINGDGTITANFAANTSSATVTMAVSPENSGTTNPGVGEHSIDVGSTIEITATPASGYHFTGWTVSGKVKVENSDLANTWAEIDGDGTTTANFAANTSSATVTMAVSPAGSGTTNPGIGDHILDVGSTIEITATPASGYHFTGWTVSGKVKVENSDLANTWAEIGGDGTITANFAANTSSATVTMAVYPASSGTTNPGVGDHAVDAGSTIEITATPAIGYHFTNWAVSGNATIADSLLISTTVLVKGNAVVSANFEENSKEVTLTMAVNTDEGGTTNPGVGEYKVQANATISIQALPSADYYFDYWQLEGDARISDRKLTKTTIVLDDNSEVTAIFQKASSTATLTLNNYPSGSGSTSPSGTVTVNVNQSYKISATPSDGYYFSKWTESENVDISNENIDKTYCVLSGDGEITANFAKSTSSVSLTMSISPENSGSTNPGIGTHSFFSGQSIEITAQAKANYHFKNWTFSGSAKIADSELISTTVLLEGDATIIANFTENSSECVLTMVTAGEGLTDPNAGKHTIKVDAYFKIIAVAAESWHFVKWSSSGPAYLADANLASTSVYLLDDATITAHFSPNTYQVDLTMAVSIEGSATTEPELGTSKVNALQTYDIKVNPADGYYFKSWRISGSGSIGNSKLATTTVVLYGDATVTALLAPVNETTSMTLAVSQADGGATIPAIGSHTVNIGETLTIEGEASDAYHFVKWTVSGGAVIANDKLFKTTVVLSKAATITANFAINSTSVELKMEISPENSGDSDPKPGHHTVNAGESFLIEAKALDGYHFIGWSLSGSGEIADTRSIETSAIILNDSVITAHFAQNTHTVELTMEATPSQGGFTHPSEGTHNVNAGESLPIQAEAEDGHYFVEWQSSSGAVIADNKNYKTVVLVKNDAIVTAKFASAYKQTVLTMMVSPEDSGATNPGQGEHKVNYGENINISASPVPGLFFTHWSADSNAFIADFTSSETIVRLKGKATVTANFAKIGTPVELEMTTHPEDAGITAPSTGTHEVTPNEWIAVSAAADNGYHFVKWLTSGNLEIDDAMSPDTTVKAKGASSLTASFAATEKTAILTLVVEDDEGGTVSPAQPTRVVIGEETEIYNNPFDGFVFVDWTVISGDALISAENASQTTVLISSDTIIAAKFAPENSGGKTNLKVIVRKNNFIDMEEPLHDSVSLKRAGMSLNEFDPETDKISLYVADTEFDVSTDNGIYRKFWEGFRFHSYDKTLSLTLNTRKERWNFKAKKIELSKHDFSDRIAARLYVNGDLNGANYSVGKKYFWSFNENKNLPVELLIKKNLKDFSIAKAHGRYYSDDQHFTKMIISKASIILSDNVVFDPGNDMVSVSVDNTYIPIPPGSFELNGSGIYVYRNKDRNIKMKLDLLKGKWSLELKKNHGYSQITNGDGIDIYLTIGDAEGGVRIKTKYRNHLYYKD